MITTTPLVSFFDCKALFDECTADERQTLVVTMLEMKEARRREKMALLMADPRHLVFLPVEKLREVTDYALEDAHQWLTSKYPEASDMVYAVEALTIFSMNKSEPTTQDLQDVVATIEEVWKAAGGKSTADLHASDMATLPTGKQESKPARAEGLPQGKAGQSLRPGAAVPPVITQESRPARAERHPKTKAGLRAQGHKIKAVSTETREGKA